MSFVIFGMKPRCLTMRKLILLLLISVPLISFPQKRSPFEKFGKITKSDLEKKLYSIDSSANAVVLASIGEPLLKEIIKTGSLSAQRFIRLFIF